MVMTQGTVQRISQDPILEGKSDTLRRLKSRLPGSLICRPWELFTGAAGLAPTGRCARLPSALVADPEWGVRGVPGPVQNT